MKFGLRLLTTFLTVLALLLGLTAVAAAQEGAAVNYTVDESAEYTVEDNGGQPLVLYNDCLSPNTEYTLGFTVAVQDEGEYDLTLATTGETTQFFDSMSFDPAGFTVSGNTEQYVTFTFKTGDTTFEESDELPEERFGIYLDADGAVLGESFLTVDIPCIAAGDDKQGGGDTQQGGTVTKTFELSLYGDVPAGESFGFSYGAVYPTGEEPSEIVVLCSEDPAYEGTVEPCEGDVTYTEEAAFPAGTELTYSWFRMNAEGDEQFHSGTETLTGDMTNSAWYEVGGKDDQQGDTGKGDDTQQGGDDDQQTGDDQQVPDKLPDTGTGGMAGLPLGGLLAAASVVAYAALRLRR